ncbi:CDG_1a_G0044700.mRNA.1.CDS.1 [Saccharomyces cerevisiae]|nr:BJ4_G0012710.mRNA.1.CDS.1 [Saccharomyces cerevisiae]CAI4723499.1 CDG_1a_G0044700.mRNA.1.CDS.1 [Saccharomyces cerevisiae]CAI4735100.1 CDA_G0044590.mRNA.1.CDS.1 [Saccharomyces cerevisiae]CAI7439908.1 CDG_1a_G0044700.mRNA.1.CDS.1 [Saccharomyces cerevisiae]CAI7439924.1 CDA_G0044590.mRNA.1.CDS.1 [Saccharomyces cerevisiae]
MMSDQENENEHAKAFLGLAKCEEEVDAIEREVELYRLNKMKPVYEKRDAYIDEIAEFWKIVLSQHVSFANYIRASDFKYIDTIDKIKVEWLALESEMHDTRDFSITFHFHGIEGDFKEQQVTKVFQIQKGKDDQEDGILTSEPVPIEWPQSYDSINPDLIKDKRSPEGKKKYRQGMKTIFGWFRWTGLKPGKEFPHGDSLASLFSEEIYPFCVKYYAEAQRDLEDEEGESGLSADGDSEDDDGSLGEVDLPLSDEEPSSKKRKV